MCTNIVTSADVIGSGKGPQGWYRVAEAVVSYDHPFHAPLDHAVNIDFVDPANGMHGRASVELSVDGARRLAEAILATVEQAEQLHRPATPAPPI